jgi:hypothetical protein
VADIDPMLPTAAYPDSSLGSGSPDDQPAGTSTGSPAYNQESPPPGQWVEVPGQWVEGRWVPSHKVWVPTNP